MTVLPSSSNLGKHRLVKIAMLAASPRPDGNSMKLAVSFREGALSKGHRVEMVDLNGTTAGGFLRDCRACRGSDGLCTIEDLYEKVIHEALLPADAVVYVTPLYFYGVAASLKNFFDRLVCYVSAGYPRSTEVIEALKGQRSALLISSEERYPGLLAGVKTQLQEMSRYLQQDFVDVVHGVGNRRGEIVNDPTDPLGATRRLGTEIFTRHVSDYTVASPRSGAVW